MPTLVLTTLCKSSVFTPDSLLRSENWQSHTCELTDGWYLLWSVSVGRLWWDWEVSEMKGGQKSVTEEKEPGVVTDCHCCYTVTKSCLTLCNPRDCSTPGLLVLHCLPEFAQVHVHWVSDAILIISSSAASSSSCLQSFPASGSFPMSQFFRSGDQSIRTSASASVPPMNIGLISIRIVWLDLLAAQGTLKRHRHVVMKREEESLALTGWSLNLDVQGQTVRKDCPGLLKTPRRVSSSGSLGHTPSGLPSSVTWAAALEGSLALVGLWGKQTRTRAGVWGRTWEGVGETAPGFPEIAEGSWASPRGAPWRACVCRKHDQQNRSLVSKGCPRTQSVVSCVEASLLHQDTSVQSSAPVL